MITDEDLVPLELFDQALSEIKHKFTSKQQLWQSLSQGIKLEQQKMVKSLGLEGKEKQKRLVDQAVIIGYLNSRLETTHVQTFQHHYKHELLYRALVKQQNEYKTAQEVAEAFNKNIDMAKLSQSGDFNAQLAKEMGKFNGKLVGGEMSESELTSQTGAQRAQHGSPQRSEVGSDHHGSVGGNSNLRNGLVQLEGAAGERRLLDEEEERELHFISEKEQAEKAHRELFKDPAGKLFDPAEKFGVLEEDGQLLYDNVTTSYKLNLPTDYYHKYIQTTMPRKEDGKGKWYIRPHHLESLTNH